MVEISSTLTMSLQLSQPPANQICESPPTDPQTGQLRYDALTSEWITVAAHRQQRAFLPPAHSCPLCPTTNGNLSELPDNFDVAVFENKGPAFGPEANLIDLPNGQRFGFATTSFGRCEVVVFSPAHSGSLVKCRLKELKRLSKLG